MERNSSDYHSYNNAGSSPSFSPYEAQFDTSMYETPMINPVAQYEQAYMYYKYLSQQMEYKIKCKEFERLNAKTS